MTNRKSEYKRIAVELGIDEKEVEKAHLSYWKFIRTKMSEPDLSGGISEEELKKLKTTFFIKYIGWFYIKYTNYIKNYKRKENDKDKERNPASEPCDSNC